MSAKNKRTAARIVLALLGGGGLLACVALALPLAYLNSAVAEEPQTAAASATPQPAARSNESLHDPSPEFLPKPTLGEEKILVALQEPAEINFNETPLAKVAGALAEAHDIDVQLDNRALEDAAIGSDTPVTRTVRGVKLNDGLDLVLRDLDLTYLIINDVLLITTPDKAETQLVTRVYPVGDLVDDANGSSLIAAITKTVAPTTWHEVGGPGAIVYVQSVKGLVVSQLSDVHGELLTLLRALRGVRRAAP